MAKILCIYHGNCDDGFAAAWAVRAGHRADIDIEFYPGVYQQEPPDVTDRRVIMVDFSYKRDVMCGILNRCEHLLLLDHHKTAMEDLAGLGNLYPGKCEVLFDMKRSGAMLAWDWFHPHDPAPLFLEYIQDRDLWRKELPSGDEFTIALRSYPQDMKVWDGLIKVGARSLIEEGRSIQRYYRLRVEEAKRSSYTAYFTLDKGETYLACRIANAPYFAASEVAGELAEQYKDEVKFGACYFEVSEGRWQYSLRSRDDFDVSAVALHFGGGGHKQAAGFTYGWPVHSNEADF